MKRIFRFSGKFFTALLALLLLLWVLIQTPFFQNRLAGWAAKRLSVELGTNVSVGGMQFGLLNRFSLSNVKINDQKGDTLISVGLLKLSVSDWFFRKDTLELTYINLSNVHIKIQRFDSVWNNNFLQNLFVVNNSDTATGKPINLKLDIAEINGLKYEKLDHWRGRYLRGGVKSMQVKGRSMDLQMGEVVLDYVKLNEPEYREIRTSGLWSISDSLAFWKRIDSMDALPWQPPSVSENPFKLLVLKVEIINGNLQFYNRRKRPSTPGEFDERDIIISKISGNAKNLSVAGDTVKASVKLSAVERSGFELLSLNTDFTMHSQMMEFANLDLVSNKSRIGPYYAMRYRHIDDMEYFIDKVEVEARLSNAKVSVEDIAVFAPELKGIKQTGLLSGNAVGTVSDFLIKNLDLRTGQSRVIGNYAMRGLTEIDNTLIDFSTNGSNIALSDLEPWAIELKQLRQTPVAKLGTVGFKGNFTGTPYDFFIKGNFTTDVGPVDADMKIKLTGENKGYSGNIYKADLMGGKLFGVPKLGRMVFSGTVKSNGFGETNPVVFSGGLNEITYNEYTYNDLKVESVFEDYLLKANLLITDPNLNGNITTTLNFREEKQRYTAKGNVTYADLFKLKLFRDSLNFRGAFDLDFEGNTLDDFLGYAKFSNASVSSGRLPLSFDSLMLQSTVAENGTKRLSLLTNEASAYVEGNFELSRLGNSFGLFLNRYYPTLIKAPEGDVPGQDFSFEVKTQEIEPFLQLFDKKLGGGNYANVFGSINTETNQLLLTGDIPSFKYDNLILTDIDLQGNGSIDELNIFGTSANIQLNEQISFPNAELKVITINDSTRFTINTNTSGPLGNAAINADIFSNPEGFMVRFNESSFIANKKKWSIEPDGGFQLKGKFLISNGLVLVQDQQRIEVLTRPSDEGEWNDLFIDLTRFNLGDWLPYFVPDPRLEGIATGKTLINDPLGTPRVNAKYEVEQFYFNDDSIGLVVIEGNYDYKTSLVDAIVKSANPGYDFDAFVKLNLSDSATRQIDSKIFIRNERLNILRKYLTDVFDDIDGFANGELSVYGPFEKPSIVGSIKVTSSSLLVGYTQCRYFIDSSIVQFGDNYIDFGVMNIQDEKGRRGRVEGRFYHRFFDSLSFALKLRTDGMQVLNTRAKDNDLFYGSAVGRATLDLAGPLNNLQMRITGTPTDSSWIAISNEESRTSGEADYIVFKEYGNEADVKVDTSNTNIHILLELTANPLCRVDVVLDELTGDIISATGNGNLSIKSGTADPTIMRGRYIIESGSYNYTFQSFIRKPFILSGNGNNFIEWNGDPYEANLNVTATYIAKDVSLRDLLANENATIALDQAARNYKGDVWVNALIKGNLSRPDIKFDIEFPQGSVMRNNISALDMLRRISEDESENLRQVTYLIVFRSFAPYRQGGSQRNPGADLAVNTISELVSREMEKILTGVIQDLTRDRSLSVDLSTNFYNSSQTLGNVNAFSQYDRVNVDFNLNKTFFNSRVKLNLGSDFDLNVRNTTATGFQFLPDVSVEFILTSNRRLRAIIFKRDNLDISGRRNRAGASISYRKDFERLFGRKNEEALIFLRNDSTD